MKISHKKTLIGSLVAFFLGTSCCWISSLVIWLGGAALLTTFVSYFSELQYFFLFIGISLSVLSAVLYFKTSNDKQNK